jgi:hypothetical protein
MAGAAALVSLVSLVSLQQPTYWKMSCHFPAIGMKQTHETNETNGEAWIGETSFFNAE